MSNYPELEAAAVHAEKVMPSSVASVVSDWLSDDAACRSNDLFGMLIVADEVMQMVPLATITETEAARDEVTNRFLDLYNATGKNLDRILELETALRERTRERDEYQDRIEKALKVIDDADAYGEDLDPDDVLTALKGDGS